MSRSVRWRIPGLHTPLCGEGCSCGLVAKHRHRGHIECCGRQKAVPHNAFALKAPIRGPDELLHPEGLLPAQH